MALHGPALVARVIEHIERRRPLAATERLRLSELLHRRPELLKPRHRAELAHTAIALLCRERAEREHVRAALADDERAWADAARRMRRRAVAAAVGVAVAAGVAYSLWPSDPTPPAASRRPGDEDVRQPRRGAEASELVPCQRVLVEPPRVVRAPDAVVVQPAISTRPPSAPRYWGSRALGLLLAVLAARLASEAVRARARRRRGADPPPPPDPVRALERFRVSEFRPVHPAALNESAALLGGSVQGEPGRAIDAVATARATAHRAGRWSAVHTCRRAPPELLVLLDVGSAGDHLWLGPLRRLVEEWRRRGVIADVWRFKRVPWQVECDRTRRRTTLAKLAEHAGGRPLLICSHQLEWAEVGSPRRAQWLGCMHAWPKRAWLDPEPKDSVHTLRGDPRDRARLEFERPGVRRFPLNEAGVVALARWLMGGRVDAVGETPLGEVDGKQAALAQWAGACALVPDPSWDDVERLRRALPDVAEALPHWQARQLLLEYLCSLPAWDDRGGKRVERPRPTDGSGGSLHLDLHLAAWLTARLSEQSPGVERAIRETLVARERAATHAPGSSAWFLQQARIWRHTYFIADRRGEALERLRALALSEGGRRLAEASLALVRLQDDYQTKAVLPPDHRQLVEGGTTALPPVVDLRGSWLRSAWSWAGAALAVAVPFEVGVRLLVPPEEFRPMPTQGEHTASLPAVWRVECSAEPPAVIPADWVDIPGKGDVEAFCLWRTEVTVAQWKRCVDAGKCSEPDAWKADAQRWSTGWKCTWKQAGTEDHPVNCVDWEQAKAFAEWVGGRLPTEQEWEHAARSGGKDQDFPWGAEPEANCDRVIMDPSESMDEASWGCGKGSTWPVCSKPLGSSEQGACDLLGNVREWTDDATGNGGELRAVRGCGWVNTARGCRASYRLDNPPVKRIDAIGLRPARSGTCLSSP